MWIIEYFVADCFVVPPTHQILQWFRRHEDYFAHHVHIWLTYQRVKCILNASLCKKFHNNTNRTPLKHESCKFVSFQQTTLIVLTIAKKIQKVERRMINLKQVFTFLKFKRNTWLVSFWLFKWYSFNLQTEVYIFCWSGCHLVSQIEEWDWSDTTTFIWIHPNTEGLLDFKINILAISLTPILKYFMSIFDKVVIFVNLLLLIYSWISINAGDDDKNWWHWRKRKTPQLNSI